MFHGSVPASVQSHIAAVARQWKATECWVGCSGNLTVERVLHACRPDMVTRGNDVTIYSCALGMFAAGQELRFSLKPEVAEAYPWLEESMQGDAADRVAVLMQATRFGGNVLREGRFFERQMRGFELQWEKIHTKTADKLRASTMKLESFTCGDVIPWLEQAPKDAAVAMYPPFFGASTAFQSDFSDLEKIFDWDDPGFVELTEERMFQLYEMIADRDEWMFGTNRRLEGWEEHLRGFSRTTNRGVPIYLYGSNPEISVSSPHQPLGVIPNRRLGVDEDLGKSMRIAPLTAGQFSQIRSQYMNAGIRPSDSQLPCAVLVDDVVVGAFALNRGKSYEPGVAYLLSDFPVAPSKYRKLSKLILYAALSTEAQVLLNRMNNGPVESVRTTAFSKNPVSMKYRGLFKLEKREKLDLKKQAWASDISPDDPYYGLPWMLNYRSTVGRWSCADGFAEWTRRYGRDT